MKKSEFTNLFIKKLKARHPDLPADVAHKIMDSLMLCIIEALVRGRRLEIRGFGSLCTKKRLAHLARNPKTAALVRVPARSYLKFKAGKKLKLRLNFPDVL